jgi:hypothetical protein
VRDIVKIEANNEMNLLRQFRESSNFD